jgi:hypothetical protein
MWHHNVSSPSELLYEMQKFNIEDFMGNITTTKLVVDADAETRVKAIELYEGITSAERVDDLKFSEEEAAQFHDQPGATWAPSRHASSIGWKMCLTPTVKVMTKRTRTVSLVHFLVIRMYLFLRQPCMLRLSFP